MLGNKKINKEDIIKNNIFELNFLLSKNLIKKNIKSIRKKVNSVSVDILKTKIFVIGSIPYIKNNIWLYIFLSKNFRDILYNNIEVKMDIINCENKTKIIFSPNKTKIILINSGYTNVLDVEKI